MAMVQYFEATDSSINSLPIKPGQLIYVKDTRKALFDSSDNTRIDLGDIVILDTGDFIPADLRIIEAVNLKSQEAALTGESLAVEKQTEKILPPD